jgi:2-polyprenyl-6-methoxyphenol hydroxylase-like FAD-dependent oxidoreductase
MTYDMIVIGGGLAGSTLAKSMAELGARVLVLERQRTFLDRVRGEALVPWGVVEARTLGIYETLLQDCGQEIGLWMSSADGVNTEQRDLVATTPHHTGILTFYHPTMQTNLLDAAEQAGAEVWRGVSVVGATPGKPPTVHVQDGDKVATLTARLVIGADGRTSRMREWGRFEVKGDPERLMIASTLHEGLRLREDAVQDVSTPGIGQTVLIFPIGRQRFRTYFMYRKLGDRRGLSGTAHAARFVQTCIAAGAPEAWYRDATVIGPLAEFEGAARWVEHPYHAGIALVGDAAGASDPSFGMGLSLALRDVRLLWDRLRTNNDWETAVHKYADDHDRDFGTVNRICGWLTELFFALGPAADARRKHVVAHLRAEPDRNLDLIAFGPALPSDEAARRRFFAEDCVA